MYLIRRKSDDNERTCPLKTMDPAVIRTLFYFVSARSQKDVSGEDSPKEWIVFFFVLFSWASKPSETGRPFFFRDAGKIKTFFPLIYPRRAQLSDVINDQESDIKRAISRIFHIRKYFIPSSIFPIRIQSNDYCTLYFIYLCIVHSPVFFSSAFSRYYLVEFNKIFSLFPEMVLN